jgi:hypothetical protein
MLPAHIIEELRKREEYAREQERPRVRLPMPEVPELGTDASLEQSSDDARGVWIVDLFG